jgi:hypothetical protein
MDELMGIANRTDFDLRTHSKKPEDAEGKRLNPDSTEDLVLLRRSHKERFYPYVIRAGRGSQSNCTRAPDGCLLGEDERQGRDARDS